MVQSIRFFCFFYLFFLILRLNGQQIEGLSQTNQLKPIDVQQHFVNNDLNNVINPNSGFILPTTTSNQNLFQTQQHPTQNTNSLLPTTTQHQNPIQSYTQIQPPISPPVLTYQVPSQPIQVPHQPQHLNLGVNQTISLYSLEIQQFLFLVSSLPSKQGILFFVINPYSNLTYEQTSIKIHIKNSTGKHQLNHCQDIGTNVCLLPGSIIKIGDNILIEIQCNSDETCMFQMETYWSMTYPLHINKPLSLNFDVDPNAKIFHLDISKLTFKELRIQLTTKTVLEADTPLHLYANFGNALPSKQKHDLSGIHLWDDGLGIFISQNEIKQNVITILVEGPPSNILQIVAKIITQYDLVLRPNFIEYDYLASAQSRVYSIAIPTKKTDMNIKLSTFTGSLQLDFYKDEALTTIFMTGTMQSFGDRLYKIKSIHLENNKIAGKFFIKVKSGATQSTYTLKLSLLNEQAIQLNTDISDMGQIDQGQIVNYFVPTFIQAHSNQSKILKFTLHNIQGHSAPVFRLCHESKQSNCHITYATFMGNKSIYDQIKPTSIVSSGNTVIYKIVLQPSLFVLDTHAKNKTFKKAILSIVLYQEAPEKLLYGIQYTDDSVVKTLRQGTPLKDRINIGSRRLYKLAPLSKDVITVHIHLVEISGSVGMFGSKVDPRSQSFGSETSLDIPTNHEITYNAEDLHNKTAFVIISGEQNGLFSLTLTFKRNISLSHSNQYTDKFNYIAIPNNVDQKITIQPNTYQVIYLSTHLAPHTFTYSSGFSLQICARKDNLKFPRAPNCDINITSTETQLPSSKAYYIGIGNAGNTTAIISVKYSNINHCEQHQLGTPWKKYLASSKLSRCVKYTIHKNQSLEILTSIDNYAYPTMHSTIYINSYQHELNQPYVFLDKKVFTQHCTQTFCIVVIMISNLTKSHIQILAQYVNHQIGLLDGISQQIHTVASVNSYKYFKFWLPNKKQTTIIVESKEGMFEFYINIKDQNQHLVSEKLYPSRTEAMYRSNNTYYTLYHTLTIKGKQLKKANCTHCVMYISVVGSQGNYVQKGRFIVQVTQQRRVLKALALTPGYLSVNSFHYYEYQFKKDSGSLVISLSTQNSNCANTYIQKGKQKATPQANIARSYGDETVVEAQKGIYSITLQATKECKYTISVSQTKIKVSEIKQGIYKDMRLTQGQVGFIFYHHIIDTHFKILSMQEYGQVMISATTMDRSSIQALENLTTIDEKSLHQFFWPGSKDILRVSTTDKGYCTNCYYLIMIKGLKKTLTSIMLYTSNIDVPMTAGDQINDIMGINEVMYYKMYTRTSKTVNVSILVHYGQIQLTVVGQSNQTRTFKKSNSTQLWTVSVHKLKDYEAVFFNVFAKADTMYRMIIKSEQSQLSKSNLKEMKVGYPTYIFLSSKQEICAEASISQKEQKLIVSSSRNDKNKFQNLTVNVKLGNKTINNTRNQIIQSTMVITLPRQDLYLPSEKTKITYCFSSDSYFSLTLIPTASITFFPENSNILVRNQQNLTINAERKLFVEIFECQGNANVILSKQFIKLRAGFSELMHWRRFGSNYLIEIEQTGPIYMNVDGTKTLVRWQHINTQKGQGLGYYYYRTPHFTSIKDNTNFQFTIPPLIQTQVVVANTTIQGVNYTLMISNSKNTLKSSIQCNIGSVLKSHQFVLGSQLNKTNKINVNISDLKKRFQNSQYLYVSVTAQLTLITPSNITQTYRFIYQDQQIFISSQSNLTVQNSQQKYGMMFWIFWALVLVVIALYFIAKIVKNKYKARQIRLQGSNSAYDTEYDVDSAR